MSDPKSYTVGWICALETELVAAASFLDEEHDDPDYLPVNDNNAYVLGRIDKHNVVMAALPNGQYGLVTAATVARDMVRSFPNVRIGLMVGIGGGGSCLKHDIRLGDIVVSCPSSGSSSGGVFQYDYGRAIQDSRFIVTGHLNQPPQFMLAALNTLKAQYRRRGNDIEKAIKDVLASNTRLQADFKKPDPSTDRLYNTGYKHAGVKEQECTTLCDASELARSPERSEDRDNPTVHYGIIASANQLMRDANLRDKLSAEHDILCFEMEAAGLMNQFPCVVIRGICDYSDTHKNKDWQGYAAMAAAAYAKDLLRKIAPNKVEAKRKLTDFLSDVKEEIHEMSIAVDVAKSSLRTAQEEKHFENVTKWLAAPEVSGNLNKAREARHPGSGQRLIDEEAYQEWKIRPNSFLWLFGIPGCGKTILTSTVIDDLLASANHSQALFYFYFDFTDTRKQTFENCVRSLLDQLYHINVRSRKEVDALYASCKNGREQPSKSSIQETFAKIVKSGETWLVLDALDECKVRDDLLLWLGDLRSDEMNLHVVATSRPEQDIQTSMKQICRSEKEKIAIHEDLLKADIQNYVHAIIKEHEDFRVWRSLPNIQEEIEISLVSKSHGMFRWVWCQIGALKRCRDPIALRKALASLPKDLDDTYSRILGNVPLEHIDQTLRILQFLTYSERPLRIDEAVDAIAVQVGPNVGQGSRFSLGDRMPDPNNIVGYCSSLAVIVERKHRNLIVQEIQLAHFSVKDYLTSDRLESKFARYFQEISARSSIADVCLAYLLELEPQMVEVITNTFHFAEYSARYWASHAHVVEYHSQQTFELAAELFLDRSRIKMWLLLSDSDENRILEYGRPILAPSLYFASLVGLPRCSKMLLDQGADVNAPGGKYGTALEAASAKGHKDIVSILLDKYADVNTESRGYGTALEAASAEGHKDVVDILLEKGADVNPSDEFTPLGSAAFHGHKEIVCSLLDKGANVDAMIASASDRTPLALAAAQGHEAVVRILLKHGAAVNDKNGARMLFDVVEGQYLEILELLLGAGANYLATDDYGRSLLTWAIILNHCRVVDFLLDVSGFDISTRDHWGATAISFAARYGRSAIFRKLAVSSSVDLHVADDFGRTPLWWARKQGHDDISSAIVQHRHLPTNEETNIVMSAWLI
ncbi:hypothetical protein PFICI_04559 [Pestalotiopsis fici W106-1]|uniref:Uncharacterized protein n=1 Tax=Pestalotiopsis fici (strain W106-1 / CGMCC3.15140) TaxID=1229662 RepID=W3X988_PESFW|nr:uncharacterized protein PFICI_04559 [Pestalotiopsis fici W106-1]ETS82683.1 hypothetical protein PFICI_04559 [Pestalotiopsis fici W106-1]